MWPGTRTKQRTPLAAALDDALLDPEQPETGALRAIAGAVARADGAGERDRAPTCLR